MSKQIIEDSILNHSENLNLINKELISSASEIIINAIKAGNNIFGVVMGEAHHRQIIYQLS